MGDSCFVAIYLGLQDDVEIPWQEKLEALSSPEFFSRMIFVEKKSMGLLSPIICVDDDFE